MSAVVTPDDLAALAPFDRVAPSELAALAGALDRHTIEPGDVIYGEGDAGDTFVVAPDDRTARQIAERREAADRQASLAKARKLLWKQLRLLLLLVFLVALGCWVVYLVENSATLIAGLRQFLTEQKLIR